TYFGVKPDSRLADWRSFQSYYQSMLDGAVLGSDQVCAELARAIVYPKDGIGVRLLGWITDFIPIETLPAHLLEPLGLKSTLWSRWRFRLFCHWFPAVFRKLPAAWQCYTRSRARL
ncbi:MAG: oxygenase MpaB family protein, partial [Verrucomicrobiota bacterium]